jgi:hypothetical protein
LVVVVMVAAVAVVVVSMVVLVVDMVMVVVVVAVMVSVVVVMVAVVVVAMVAAMLYTHNGSDDTVDWFCFCFENVLEHGVSLSEDLVTTDAKHDD